MKKFILFIAVLFLAHISYSQISHGGQPRSFETSGLKANIDYRIMPEVDVEQLLMEDAIDENDPDIPWRFGKDMAVDFNLNNSGTWETLQNGDRIWRLEITSYGAFSLNLIYDEFYMPPGADFFVYNAQKSHVIGSFTEENHKPNGGFATIPVKGETSILEYYEPAEFTGQGKLAVSYVIHAYKDFYHDADKGFGNSGDCNVNVNCPEGDEWRDQQRGVAMILTQNNARKCTGSMINNTANDGTPYFLTANHCAGGESTWIIMFNYESPGCDDIDGPTNQSVQYTTKRASSATSDMLLLELSAVPPASYNVYYNGWDRIDESASHSTTIHHPRGDIKKISFDDDPYTSDKYLGSNGENDSHWKITQWDLGTTEGGSSGSPLFNPQKQIVGQLHGGWASCNSLTSDWFGKFSTSWDYYSEPEKSLKSWLDPLETGAIAIQGYDPGISQYENNAQLSSIISPENVYEGYSFIRPHFIIQNKGTENLQSLEITYQINDGELVQQTWTGDLSQSDTAHVYFPEIELNFGNYEFLVYTNSPNDVEDEYPENDTLSRTVDVLRTYDLALTNLLTPNGVDCSSDSTKLEFTVNNLGLREVDGIIAELNIDNEIYGIYELPGSINVGSSKNYVLSVLEQDAEWHTLELTIEILDETDQFPEDNVAQATYNTYGNRIFVQLETDENSSETSWIIKDSENEIIAFENDFIDDEEYKFNFCFPAGCYTFTIYDEGGDGIQSNNGFNLLNVTADTLYANNPDFQDSISIPFCFADGLTSDFIVEKDTSCMNRDVQFTNRSLNATTYEWSFEGGNPPTSNEVSPIIQYKNPGVFDVKLKALQGDIFIENLKEDFITIVNCAGLTEVQNDMFKIYPNPSTGAFMIELQDQRSYQELVIYNSIGEMVWFEKLNNLAQQAFQVNLDAGLYIVEIKSEFLSEKRRLLIK